MATDNLNIPEDAEMADCEGDKVVTMMDVLQEQQEFEEDANAVLGASDDKNCTYAKGYIKRQAIYACLTCCPDVKTDPTKRAGVCLACSLNCHESHELVELYTKRNFRCDCGNPKFSSHPCQFTPNKTDLNEDNIYNQNFSGLYCTCQRPYPDPESTFEDDMIQCIICEDWLHASHLDAVVPANDQYSEMICKGCMDKNEFLHDYTDSAVNSETGDVDIVNVNGNHSVEASFCNGNDSSNFEISENKENIEYLKTPLLQDEREELASDGNISEETAKEDTESNDTNNTMDLGCESKEQETVEDKEQSENAKSSENLPCDKSVDSTQNKENTDFKANNTLEMKDTLNDTKLDDNVSDIANPESNVEESKDKEDSSGESSELENGSKKSHDENDLAVESSKEQTNESSEAVPTSESSNFEVPDTSQTSDKENIDDKTDSVMDAIDALLESTTEEKDHTKETTSEEEPTKTKEPAQEESPITKENPEVNEVDMPEKEDKLDEKVPEQIETLTTDSIEKTDIEMNEPSSQDESPAIVNNETTEQNESTTDTDKKSSAGDNDNTDSSIISNKDEALNNVDDKNEPENKDSSQKEPNNESNKESVATEGSKRKHSTEISEESSPKKTKLDIGKCVRPKGVKKHHKGATFWPSNFRQKLCTCGDCIYMYKELNVMFLTDLEDSVSAYEILGKKNMDGGASQYEKGLQALSSLDRIQQINALTEYNRMRDKLLDFLKSFKDRKEIVKEEDIKAFFAGMKPRREPDGVYFCR